MSGLKESRREDDCASSYTLRQGPKYVLFLFCLVMFSTFELGRRMLFMSGLPVTTTTTTSSVSVQRLNLMMNDDAASFADYDYLLMSQDEQVLRWVEDHENALNTGSVSKDDEGRLASSFTSMEARIHPNNGTATAEVETPNAIQLPQHNRSIILVHVGKAGGSSLRKKVALCHLSREPSRVQTCLANHQRNANRTGSRLAIQTQHVIHLWANLNEKNYEVVREATSFLVTLRNPVDRVISTYRYSHPDNCPNKTKMTTWGCEVHRMKLLEKEHGFPVKLWQTCFPMPQMEEFAMATLDPWKPKANYSMHLGSLTPDLQRECRQIARHVIQGRAVSRAAPHFSYNYLYYATNSVYRFPDKEVLAVRTEHEWEDMLALDIAIGGTGKAFEQVAQSNFKHSHGSENYAPSPLSTEAYHKMCCVLHSEISIYFDLLERAQNLLPAQKQASRDDLLQKCGIYKFGDGDTNTATTSSNAPNAKVLAWYEWQAQCERRVQEREWQEQGRWILF